MQKPIVEFNQPLIDKNGLATEHFEFVMNYISRFLPLFGTGSPEGVVEALQYSLYIDTSASAGSSHYWKKSTDVAGDTKKGWQLI